MELQLFDPGFHAVLSMSSDAMMVIHENTLDILQANPAALRLYGYTSEELSKKRYDELSDDPKLTKRIIAEGYSYYSGITHIRKNGKPFTADICYGQIIHNDTKYVLVNIRAMGIDAECLEQLRKKGMAPLRDNNAHNKEYEKAFIDGEESERMRMAKDLHDHIGQLLVSAKFTLEKYFLLKKEKEKADHINKTIDQLANLIVEIRQVTRNVFTGFIKEKSLEKAITNLIQESVKNEKINIHFKHTAIPANFSATAQINIYRIMQEILSNMLKHAGATEVHISISAEDQFLHIKTIDNGTGIQSHPPKDSFGLTIMGHRVEQLGGSFQFSSIFGKTFETNIRIPLKNCFVKAIDYY